MGKSAKAKAYAKPTQQINPNEASSNNKSSKGVDKVQNDDTISKVARKRAQGQSKKKSKELKQAVKDALNVKVNSGDKLVPIKVTDDIRSLANKTHITRWLTAVNDVIEAAKEKKVPESVYSMMNFKDTRVDGKLVFNDHVSIRPTLDLDKEYEVEIQATAVSMPKPKTRGASSSSSTTEEEEEDPAFEYIVHGGVRVKVPKLIFVKRTLNGGQLEAATSIKCSEFEQDKYVHQEKLKKWESEQNDLQSHKEIMFNLLHDKLSDTSKKAVYDKMNMRKEEVIAAKNFSTLRDAVRDVHHPEFVTGMLDPLARDTKLHSSSIQYLNPVQRENESMEEYCQRAKDSYDYLVQVQNICTVLPFRAPATEVFIRNVAAGVHKSKTSAYQYCHAMLGYDPVNQPAMPATLDDLMSILKLKDAIVQRESKKEMKRKEKEKQEKFLSMLSQTLAYDEGNSKAKKRPPPTDVRPALRTLIEPSRLDNETLKSLSGALNKELEARGGKRDQQTKKRQKQQHDKSDSSFHPGSQPNTKGNKNPRGRPKTREGGFKQMRQVPTNSSTFFTENNTVTEEEEEDNDDEDDEDDEDDDEEISFSNNFIQSRSIHTHNVYDYLKNLTKTVITSEQLALLGLIERKDIKKYNNQMKYDLDLHSYFTRQDKSIVNQISIAINGAQVLDSGSSVNITRDRELLVDGSIREIPKKFKVNVNGTFGVGHSPKYYAQHKILGFTLYDPNSAANIISFSYCWATGWEYYVDNANKHIIMRHPDRDESCNYLFAVNQEKVLTGLDPSTFSSWNQTYTIKPLGFMANFLSDKLCRKQHKHNLLDMLSEDDIKAFAFSSLSGRPGNRSTSTN